MGKQMPSYIYKIQILCCVYVRYVAYSDSLKRFILIYQTGGQ